MLNIKSISNTEKVLINGNKKKSVSKKANTQYFSMPAEYKKVTAENLKGYIPSFGVNKNEKIPSISKQYKIIESQLDNITKKKLKSLEARGILSNNDSNDGSTVLENLYKIATEPRIKGLSNNQIITEVINSLYNPFSITQKFGDISENTAKEISKETGITLPKSAERVVSSCCVVASMEFNLAHKKPAEFTRFANGLSGSEYSVDKKVKMSDIDQYYMSSLCRLKDFNTEYKIDKDWENITVKIKPDRNAIVRARVQASNRDPGERSSVDVLIQSALLNLGSQNTYNALTDERQTGKYNNDKNGLTDVEKNFVENIVLGVPKISVVYQQLDENGYLTGYNGTHEETKQHILKSLEQGQNVIIGYTHIDDKGQIDGGHEITIIDYKQDNSGKGYFICNDTDDELDTPIQIEEDKLIPLIHHAGISKSALSKDDVIVEPWREIVLAFQEMLKAEKNA